MDADVPSGLTPLENKTPISSEIKASNIQSAKGQELPEKNELLPETDRVQIMHDSDSSYLTLPYRLTNDKCLNEYITMLNQLATEEKNSKKVEKKGDWSNYPQNDQNLGKDNKFDLNA